MNFDVLIILFCPRSLFKNQCCLSVGVHVGVPYLHTLVIRLLSEGDVSDCESTAV